MLLLTFSRKNSVSTLNAAAAVNNGGDAVAAANQPVTRVDLDALKREILLEFRKEIAQLKSDILSGMSALSGTGESPLSVLEGGNSFFNKLPDVLALGKCYDIWMGVELCVGPCLLSKKRSFHTSS